MSRLSPHDAAPKAGGLPGADVRRRSAASTAPDAALKIEPSTGLPMGPAIGAMARTPWPDYWIERFLKSASWNPGEPSPVRRLEVLRSFLEKHRLRPDLIPAAARNDFIRALPEEGRAEAESLLGLFYRVLFDGPSAPSAPSSPPRLPRIKEEEALSLLRFELKARNFSPKTRSNYAAILKRLYVDFPQGFEKVERFALQNHILTRYHGQGRKPGTCNLALAGIKFFFTQVLKRPEKVEGLMRMKEPHRLPRVYSVAEVKRLLDAPSNAKHRLVLALAYGCGLRVSELAALRPGDLDFDRGMLWVRSGKGAKDRGVMLGERLKERLREHLAAGPGSKFLFEGFQKERPLSVRTLEKIHENACAQAGLRGKGGIHVLRHSFATHLLENGTDMRYIQKLLGHGSTRTTEIYTHVTQTAISRIRSPLDLL